MRHRQLGTRLAGFLGRAGVLGVVVGLWAVWGAALAPADELTQRLEAHLLAGEFGPALQAVQQLSDLEQRDRWLGRIAQRQAAVGAREASLYTLAGIQNDTARRDALAGFPGRAAGAAGGAAMADFDTLINLITSAIAPDSWEDVGGAGAIEPFPTGVYVDAAGLMKRLGPPRDSTRTGDHRTPQGLAGPTRKATAIAQRVWRAAG
jgi:hypothetical protein